MTGGGIVSIFLAITTVALIFALVSSTNTANIISAATGGFASSIKAALGK